jgi:hypothetical protein
MKIFSPVFSGDMKEANSSASDPQPLALLSGDEKALIDKMSVRDDGALTVDGIPVDRASGAVGGVVVDALPTDGLFPGMKCIVPNVGTYYYDARRHRWVQVESFENAYDIALYAFDGYDLGSVICSVPIPRAAKLPINLVGSAAKSSDQTAIAQFELYLETDVIGTVTFDQSGTGKVEGLQDFVFIKSGEMLTLKSVTGTLDDVSVVLKAELLSA